MMPSHQSHPTDLQFLGKETLYRLSKLLHDRGLHALLREPRTWTPAEGDTSFSLGFEPARLDVAIAALADALRERQFVQFYKPDMPPARMTESVVVVASATLRLALMVVRDYEAATMSTSYRFVVRGRVSEVATRVRSGRELLTV
jgi:hypothetical protein